jgi:hypothetical protein
VKEILWRAFARFVSCEPVANYLIKRAKRTPYFPLKDRATGSTYMERYHLFNPPDPVTKEKRFPGLPWVRIHWIRRRDMERDKHNHPADARTIVMKGWYVEDREDRSHVRLAGDTATIDANVFHSIRLVSSGGVWTMFFFWDWKQVWGFKTIGGFVPWRKYLGIAEGKDE